MRVAICDDDEKAIKILTGFLEQYNKTSLEKITYDLFSDPLSLLKEVESKNFDLIFLDIIMPGLNGIQTAMDIRKADHNVKIIFLTSSAEFALASYEVRAYDYLIKPFNEQRLKDSLDRLIISRSLERESLTIRLPKEIITLPFSRVESLAVTNHALTITFDDNHTKSFWGKLSDYEEAFLSRPEFIKPHRAFIVNMNLMKSINADGFISFNNNRIPVSRTLQKQVKDRYARFVYTSIQ